MLLAQTLITFLSVQERLYDEKKLSEKVVVWDYFPKFHILRHVLRYRTGLQNILSRQIFFFSKSGKTYEGI